MNMSVKEYSDPFYWRGVIENDQTSEARSAWKSNCVLADNLLNNEFESGINSVENIYWYRTATYPRMRSYVMGRVAHGLIIPKVTGTQVGDDESVARAYSNLVQWEFVRSKGTKRIVGRRELTQSLYDWIDYGLGVLNVHFNPMMRDRENPTGSIMVESVSPQHVILDSSVKRLADLGRVSRIHEMREGQVRHYFPAYRGELTPNKDGMCNLYEVQFRTERPMKYRINNPDGMDFTQDQRPYWKSKDDFMAGLREEQNEEAEKLWKSFKLDYVCVPLVYSMMFLGHQEKAELNVVLQEPTYVGDDFSYVLIPFIKIPNNVYPVGVPFYINDLNKLEVILKTFYVRQMLRVNNSGGFVNIDKIQGKSETHIKNLMTQFGYWVPVTGDLTANDIFSQMRYQPPDRASLDLAAFIRWEQDEFLNVHEAQTGQAPFAGASGELTKVLQAAGNYPLAGLMDEIRYFAAGTFQRIAKLAHRFMPPEKKVQIVETPQDQMVIKRETLRKVDPNDLDITVDLNLDTEGEKNSKLTKGLTLFQLGLMAPRQVLQDAGYRNYEQILSEVADYRTGQAMAQALKEDPEFAQAVTEYNKTKLLQMQMKGQSTNVS